MYKEKIFTDRQIPENEKSLVYTIFMPLVLMNKKQMNKFLKNEPCVLFEYLDKASPRGVNGFPCFSSFDYLNDEETKIVFDCFNKFKKLEEKINV